jgi:glycosyltransferase involved in cell wall biosynthesis
VSAPQEQQVKLAAANRPLELGARRVPVDDGGGCTFSLKSSATRDTRLLRAFSKVKSKYRATKDLEGTRAAISAVFVSSTKFVVRRLRSSLVPFVRLKDYLALLPMPTMFMQRDILFIGYLEAGMGLGQSLRSLVRSVAGAQLPFVLFPYRRGVETRLAGPFMEHLYDRKRRHCINVFEMAADQVEAAFREIGRWKYSQSYNVLRTYWELDKVPPHWALMLRRIDEIWVPNLFVASAFRDVFSGPIHVIPPAVDVDEKGDFARDHFGLDADKFYFMFSFDYFSYTARKNPLGVIRAFQAAFPTSGSFNVGLVIKTVGTSFSVSEITSAILAAARTDQRVKVISSMLSRSEMLSLLDHIDCYVSLHRSEGFGLGMAEAMALGKPVIGTAYSGNTEYLTDRTGFPVSYHLRPVLSGEYIDSDGQSWAEPDDVAAVEAMRHVVEDREDRERRAATGKAYVGYHYSLERVGEVASIRLRNILETLASRGKMAAYRRHRVR